MATIAEQLTSLANTKTAIKDAIVAKGVAVSDSDTFRSYADKIGQIESGGGSASATKLGVSIDNMIGDVDANGVLQSPSVPFEIKAVGVKVIGAYAMQYKFRGLSNATSADFSSVETIETYGLYYAMPDSGVVSVDFSNLKVVNARGLYGAFSGSAVETANFSNLETISGYGCYEIFRGTPLKTIDLHNLVSVSDSGLYNAFDASMLESIDLSALTTLGSYAFRGAFSDTEIKSISFPALTSVQANSFGTSSSSTQAFRNCTELTEIHFRADMQATIEACDGYANKFGATSSAIYFDL